MRKIPPEYWMLYGITLVVVAGLTHLLHEVKRTQGKRVIWHVLFSMATAALLLFTPAWVQDELFSPGGVLLIGTLLPIYETIVAVCTITTTDDQAWLQYWITAAVFNFGTEFVDEITAQLPAAGEHWYELEFFVTLWLVLPWTDGAGLLYRTLTLPWLAPAAVVWQKRLEGYMGALLTAVNTTHLWIVWFVFLTLPEDARRFVVVALGVVYPTLASIGALTSSNTITTRTTTPGTPTPNDTATIFWLTYWASYSVLFIAMDYLENFVGHIRGFYSICAVATVYLFLPMFNGADVVFRRVLVPLSGQYENLLLHDAYVVKRDMEAKLPRSHRERVLNKAAELFASGGGGTTTKES